MGNEISILFDAYHLYHLPQFDPLIDLLENDKRFKVYYSTYSQNRKEEVEICSSILKKRTGEFIFDSEFCSTNLYPFKLKVIFSFSRKEDIFLI